MASNYTELDLIVEVLDEGDGRYGLRVQTYWVEDLHDEVYTTAETLADAAAEVVRTAILKGMADRSSSVWVRYSDGKAFEV
ncbi:hypothetical protein D8Y23_08890 [Microbacterium enclense]|uniref:Uncharacterized protein n=1 Tax=Microbacterium enclense TaxID=993073 RepID=A0A3S3KXZ2_9MICO|nr:hypothetical protein [Microbacterium enclense]RWR18874.1 hypothetical protein D8Y23_08890 [Microbacterium enclense]